MRASKLFRLLLCIAPAALATLGGAQEAGPGSRTFLIRGATVLTVSGESIPGGSVLVQDGRIAAVGASVEAPPGVPVVEATGRYVMPGVIDCHSHIAVQGGVNEGSLAVTSMVDIGEVIEPDDINIYRDLAGGVTTANILHGSANPIGGRNQVIKLRWGADADGLRFREAPPGIKFALGENVKRPGNPRDGGTPRYPATRMGVEDVIRDAFNRARAYGKAWEDCESKKGRGVPVLPPRKDLELEPLLEILQGKRLVHCHCYRSDEIVMMIRLAEEFGFKIATFQHVLEGYKVAREIAAHGAGASTFSDWWAYKVEAYDAIPHNAALMTRAGIVVSINSDSAEEARHLNQEAAKCIRYGGLTENQALRLITLNPARQLGISRWVGSIEAGKDADLVLYDRHPLSARAMAQKVWIDGRLLFDRESERDRSRRIEEQKAALRKKDAADPPMRSGASGQRMFTLPAPAVEYPPPGAVEVPPAAVAPPAAPDGTLVIRGARLYPVASPPIPKGNLVITGGRIAAIGSDAAIPAGARVIDGAGLNVYPGLIDANTTMGLAEIASVQETLDTNEVGRFNPQLRAYEAVHAESEHVPVARAGGVTTALVLPRGGVLCGQPVVIDLDGETVRSMAVLPSAGIAANLPLPRPPARFGRRAQSAPAGDPRRDYESQMRELAALLDQARHYGNAKLAAARDASLPNVRRDEKLEALLPLLRRQVPLFAFAGSRQAIRTAVEFAEKQKLRLVIVGGDDAGKLVDLLKEKKVPVIYGPVQSLPSEEDDPYDLPYATPGILARAGVPFAISPGSTSASRTLPIEAGTAAGNGLSDEDALKAVTLYPAQILGIADRLGSLEPGKIANIVIADGDILEPRTTVRHVLIRGRETSLETRHTRLYERYRK